MSKTTFTRNLIVAALLISLASVFTTQTAQATAISDVPAADIAGYQQIYQFTPTPGFNWGTTNHYTTDNSGTSLPEGFSRIGYYMEFQTATGPRDWVWVSMDAFKTDLTKIGVPTVANGGLYHYGNTTITDMTVRSNVGSIVQGTNIGTGNIEFWPSNYSGANSYGVPNAGAGYDFGDGGASLTAGGYGSMQIHNYDLDGDGAGIVGQVLFNYGRFNGLNGELGIGGSSDYTLTDNGATFTLANIEIWVEEIIPVPEPSSFLLLGFGALGMMRHTRRRRRRA